MLRRLINNNIKLIFNRAVYTKFTYNLDKFIKTYSSSDNIKNKFNKNNYELYDDNTVYSDLEFFTRRFLIKRDISNLLYINKLIGKKSVNILAVNRDHDFYVYYYKIYKLEFEKEFKGCTLHLINNNLEDLDDIEDDYIYYVARWDSNK